MQKCIQAYIKSETLMTYVIITSSFELQIKHQTIDADVRVSHNLFLVQLYASMIFFLFLRKKKRMRRHKSLPRQNHHKLI